MLTLPLVQSNGLFFDTGLHSYFGFSGGTRRDTGCLFLLLSDDYPNHYQSTKFQSNEQQEKKNEVQTDFSYYGLYLLDYLRNNKFEQASDTAFIRERADRAAETYEQARLDGYPTEGAQELAINILLRGLHYSSMPSSAKSWKASLPMMCRRISRMASLPDCFRSSMRCSPFTTSRTTTSPCRPTTTCCARS